jgi:hypothetical protein
MVLQQGGVGDTRHGRGRASREGARRVAPRAAAAALRVAAAPMAIETRRFLMHANLSQMA